MKYLKSIRQEMNLSFIITQKISGLLVGHLLEHSRQKKKQKQLQDYIQAKGKFK
tara:strand:+ start:1395 stop:1556 length:162 start_codon:yes stop_codon:yes gene_type:complete